MFVGIRDLDLELDGESREAVEEAEEGRTFSLGVGEPC